MFAPSATANVLAVLSAILAVIVAPFNVVVPVVFPAVRLLPAPDAKEVVPDEVRVVKAAVEGVSVPMAVPLIPVAVVLKFAAVIVRSLEPVLIDEADNPESERAPDVAVRFNAPVVWVKPFDAVSNPLEVIVPVPVVAIFPVVDNVPFSLIVKVLTPPDWIASEVFVAALVSLMTKALAVPALVKVKDVAVPLSVEASYKVKAIFRPVVVVIVLPVLYAACKPNGAPLHLVTLLEPSTQSAVPVAVPKPVRTRYELLVLSVLIVILLFVPGVKVDVPSAWKV